MTFLPSGFLNLNGLISNTVMKLFLNAQNLVILLSRYKIVFPTNAKGYLEKWKFKLEI